jgi:hypothetical protein
MNRNTETEPPEEITDEVAKKWYKEGFRFAINWIHEVLPETNSGKHLTKDDFEEFLDDALNEGVDPDYFKDHPFNSSDRYPVGQCPGDVVGTCIQCADGAITPFEET